MSKKILKRSLALGALMAFVITGSAMATEWTSKTILDELPDFCHETIHPGDRYEIDTSSGNATFINVYHNDVFDSWEDFKEKNNIINHFEKNFYPGSMTLNNKDEATVTVNGSISFTGNNGSSPYGKYLDTDLNGFNLHIINNTDNLGEAAVYTANPYKGFSNENDSFGEVAGPSSDYGYYYRHIYTNLKDTVLPLPGFKFYNGDLEIESGGIGIQGHGIIENVGTLKVTSVNNAITSIINYDGKTDGITIDAANVELNVGTKGNALQVNDNLSITSDVLKITNIKDSSYQRPIRVDGAIANIYTDTLNISGATEATKVSSGTLKLVVNEAGSITNEFYAASTGTIDATLGAGVEWTGKFVTDTDATKGALDLSGKWTLKDVANDTIEKGKANSLTEATFRKGSTFVIDGATYEKSTGKYALNGVGDKATLTVENGAKLKINGITETTYNIAQGFTNLKDAEGKWEVSDINTLMQGVAWTSEEGLQVEVFAKKAEQMANDTGMSESTAGLVQNIIENAKTADTPAEKAAVEFIEKVQANNSAPEAVGNAINNATKMGEAGGNSATAASIVKNVTGVTNDRLSFNCGHSAPHKGGHGVGLFEEGSGADVWVEYVHGKDEVEDMPSTAGASSYEGQYNGIVMGVDFKKVNKFQSGIAFNYGEGDTNSVGNAVRTHSDYDFWGVGYYGSIHNDDSNVIFDISYAQTDSDVTQNNSGTAFEANPETTTWSAGVKLEKLYQNENVQIVPYTGLRYMSIDADDYSTRNGEFYYSMDRQDIWLLPLGVSIRQEIANDNGWTVSPRVDLSYIWAFGDTNSNMEVKSPFAGVSQLGYDVMDDGSFLGLVGIEAHKGQWGYGVAYSYQKGDHSESKKWYVDVNYSF